MGGIAAILQMDAGVHFRGYGCLPVEFSNVSRSSWKATGIRVLLRRADLCKASAISARVDSPDENLATRSRHITGRDLPAWRGGRITTPCRPAHATISAVV